MPLESPLAAPLIPAVPDILDLAHLERQTGADQELAAELLGLFEVQAAEILGRITGGEPASPLAHRLKGAARAVGAWQVAAAANEIEDGRGGAGPLGEAVRRACLAIARHRASPTPLARMADGQYRG